MNTTLYCTSSGDDVKSKTGQVWLWIHWDVGQLRKVQERCNLAAPLVRRPQELDQSLTAPDGPLLWCGSINARKRGIWGNWTWESSIQGFLTYHWHAYSKGSFGATSPVKILAENQTYFKISRISAWRAWMVPNIPPCPHTHAPTRLYMYNMYIYLCLYIYICVYIDIHHLNVYMYIHIYIHTYIHTACHLAMFQRASRGPSRKITELLVPPGAMKNQSHFVTLW